MDERLESSPFRLSGALAGGGRLNLLIERILERTLGLDELDRRYRALPAERDPTDFPDHALSALDITVAVDAAELEHIPAHGATVIVSNHPFGGLEGVIMAKLLGRKRTDVRIMANHHLLRVPEMRRLLIPVDPFGGPGATQRNVPAMRQAIRWLRRGGVLMVFPAGEVSHVHLTSRNITDPPWSSTISRIIRLAESNVLPVYFQGANSVLFQVLGLMHARLRTALLPRELLNKSHQRIPVRIGRLLPWRKLAGFDDDAIAAILRLRTYALGTSSTNKGPDSGRLDDIPVAPPHPSALLTEEIQRLGQEHFLCSNGELDVYIARAAQVPRILEEIGRLRELTFRAAGEGSGKSIDVDRFDKHYLHLFAWNPERAELVGAYRLGLTDEILQHSGKRGLYTHSLFHYKRHLLNELDPAIELGRAFIRRDYQRSFAPLMLMWKGIGRIVCREPRYRILFGPVSISREYQTLSQQLLIEFLKRHSFADNLAHLIKPRHPFRSKTRMGDADTRLDLVRSLEEVSDLVTDIELDHKGPPILLKHYLKLGGRMLGFNVDPDFGNAIDCLVMVDLTRTNRRVLQRYMGKDAAAEFLALQEPVKTSLNGAI